MRRWLILAALLLASPVDAQEVDFLLTNGKLPIDDFYHLVACRALPGRGCTNEMIRWSPDSARDLRVGFAPVPPDYPPQLARSMSTALDAAIVEINGAAAALHLGRAVKGEVPPITIHLSPAMDGQPIRGTGIRDIDGTPIGAALVTVWWDDLNHITDAVIVMAADLPKDEVLPVILEELCQAMGLLTDIRNPVYNAVSVFSEDSNSVKRLGAQDRAALRLHYPQD